MYPITQGTVGGLFSQFFSSKKKITVAISGEGADELFGGYPRYKNILFDESCS